MIVEVLPEAAWQWLFPWIFLRLRNALGYAPSDDHGGRRGAARLRELRLLDDRHDLPRARCDMAPWLVRWQATDP